MKIRFPRLLVAGLLLMVAPVFAQAAGWTVDYPKAVAEAKRENKEVLLDFTGSDWCVWCKRTEAEIFSKREFKDYAASHLVLVRLDFPDQKPQPEQVKVQNESLRKQYGMFVFPTFILLGPSGKVLWRQEGYLPGGVSAFLGELRKY